MNNNANLHKAKKAKNDEFYTQYEDIEKELQHYIPHFKDKVVYCNCDDPEWSNFWKFFIDHFKEYGLKQLISTHYNIDGSPTYRLDYDGSHYVRVKLTGDGDFRSEECTSALKEADIVCTNPPFSLFRDFMRLLFEYEKKFLVIGNKNAVTYKDIFPYIKDNKMWIGASIHSGGRNFCVPDNYTESNNFAYDSQGHKYVNYSGARWFTNLDYQQRHLSFWSRVSNPCLYNARKYPHYDNYDAINVDKTSEIPIDYSGVIGVPITWLDKYNPEEFEIVGATESEGTGLSHGLWHSSKIKQASVNGIKKYKRIFIRTVNFNHPNNANTLDRAEIVL